MSELLSQSRSVNLYITPEIARNQPTEVFPFSADTTAIDSVVRVLQYHAHKPYHGKNITRIWPHPKGISSQGLDLIIGASSSECVDVMMAHLQENEDTTRLYQVDGNILKPTRLGNLYNRPVPKVGIRPDENGKVNGVMLAADLLGLDPHSLENTGLLHGGTKSDIMGEVYASEKKALLQDATPHLPLSILTHNTQQLY